MDKVADEKIRAARARVAYLRPYFSHAVFALVLVQTEACPSMAVDEWRRLYYGPGFVHKYPITALTTVVLHELEHVLREHGKRARALGVTAVTAEIANVAQDCSINAGLRVQVKERPQDELALPGRPWFPEMIGCPEGWAWEQYFSHLIDHATIIELEGFEDCGSGCHGQVRSWEVGSPNQGPRVEGVDDAAWFHVQQLTADAIKQRQRSRGDIAGGWEEWADTFLRPKRIPWDVKLRGQLRRSIAQAAGDSFYTYAFPSRLQQAIPDAIFPAMRSPQPNIVFIGDTSGSMNAETDLALVRGVVTDLCEQMGVPITFLSVDAAVHGPPQRVQGGRQLHLIGRGGTDMAAGIEYAATKLRPRPDAIVVATDCQTGWGERPRGVPVVVCGVGDDEEAFADVPPWATFIRVEAVDVP